MRRFIHVVKHRERNPGILVFWVFLLAFALLPGVAHAGGGNGGTDTSAGAEACTTDTTFYLVLNPNETKTIPVNAFCMNRGKPFPGNEMAFSEAAPADVQAAIRYSVDQGYNQQMPELWSVQLAVWNLLDNQHPNDAGHKLADEIIAYAKEHANDKPECVISESIALSDAAKAGLVEATMDDFKDVSPKGYDFYGEGTLTVKNLTDRVQVLNIPYGTRFDDVNQEGVQGMAVFPGATATPDQPPKPALPETGGLLPAEAIIILALMLSGAALFVMGKRVLNR